MAGPTVGLKRKGQRKLTVIDQTKAELFDFIVGPHCRIYWKVLFSPSPGISLFFHLWTNVGPMMDLSTLFQQLVGTLNLNHVRPVPFLFSVHFSYVWVISFLFAWFYIPSFQSIGGPLLWIHMWVLSRELHFFAVQFSSISAIFFFQVLSSGLTIHFYQIVGP